MRCAGQIQRQLRGIRPQLSAGGLARGLDLALRLSVKLPDVRRGLLADALAFALHLCPGLHPESFDIGGEAAHALRGSPRRAPPIPA